MKYKGFKAFHKCCKKCLHKKGIKCLDKPCMIKNSNIRYCSNLVPIDNLKTFDRIHKHYEHLKSLAERTNYLSNGFSRKFNEVAEYAEKAAFWAGAKNMYLNK